tara:strand:- start:1109 stop:1327 length:219 start_codon:yes stop_codon:yes gene_type:complete
MGRKLIHEHWGDSDNNRSAKIYHVEDIMDFFEVDFYEDEQLKESRQMITNGVAHSERYAEDAAENWCLGYIP